MQHDRVVRFEAAGRQHRRDGVVAVVDVRVAGIQTLKNFSVSLKQKKVRISLRVLEILKCNFDKLKFAI